MKEKKIAIVRPIPNSFANCVTKHNERPDVQKAQNQWNLYIAALEKACTVYKLPVLEAFPDSVFVEDTCVVVGKKALITIIGHPSRNGEQEAMHEQLKKIGIECVKMTKGTLDGGDVLYTGRHLLVGLSARTSVEGIDELKNAFPDTPVIPIPIPNAALHLKCLVTHLAGDNHLVVVDSPEGREVFDFIQTKASGDYCACFVPDIINANVLSFPEQKVILQQSKCEKSIAIVNKYLKEVVVESDWTSVVLTMSETIKGDGCLTCQSVIIDQL